VTEGFHESNSFGGRETLGDGRGSVTGCRRDLVARFRRDFIPGFPRDFVMGSLLDFVTPTEARPSGSAFSPATTEERHGC